MLVKIDDVSKFSFKDSKAIDGEIRSYYTAKSKEFMLVCRGGHKLSDLEGKVVDAQTNKDQAGFDRIMIYRAVTAGEYQSTLSEILAHAPE